VRSFPRSRTRTGVTMMLAASLVALAFTSPPPSVASSGDDPKPGHDKLHRAKHRLDRNINKKADDLDEISKRLLRAQARVEGAWSDLRSAKAHLRDVKEQVHEAAVRDREMQDLLRQAIITLQDARTDLYQGAQDVKVQRAALASYAVSSYQTGGPGVLNIGVAFDAQSPQEALDNMQASATVLDKQTVSLQQFEATKVLLRLTEERVEATKEDVAVKRQQAAEILQTKIELKQAARDAKEQVRNQLGNFQDAKQEIAAAKQREKHRLKKMQNERERIENKLQKIAQRRAAKHRHWLATHRPSPPTFSSGGGYLSWPVNNTYITSPYGMRMHPILHVYKLHDGTDFHADCGTPVYAAANGRVLSEYYNAGYGNRIILDHGFVRGVSLQTSYNHLTSFVARPGHFVHQGQLIAYSGTTGYSTGCHLHFMVYVNGNTVDPMNWL
jgi:murein DD-endopeptidase MepM/ murein hydrolase activator NlpD